MTHSVQKSIASSLPKAEANKKAAKVGFLVRVDVKPGKEAEFEAALRATLPVIEQETGTIAWFAVRLGPSSYAVVDVFPDEASRQVHLEAGRARLKEIAGLFAGSPSIIPTDIIAAKLP